jgi:hypothetical protein
MKKALIERGNKLFKEFKNEENQKIKSKKYGEILDLKIEAQKRLSKEDYKEFEENWIFRHTLATSKDIQSLEDLEKLLKKDTKRKS